MNSTIRKNDLSALYAPGETVSRNRCTPADQALGHLSDAWKALDLLEAAITKDMQRWDAESLMTARKGTRRAWLALSNLSRSLHAKRGRDRNGEET
jgi:hypothetical protein